MKAMMKRLTRRMMKDSSTSNTSRVCLLVRGGSGLRRVSYAVLYLALSLAWLLL